MNKQLLYVPDCLALKFSWKTGIGCLVCMRAKKLHIRATGICLLSTYLPYCPADGKKGLVEKMYVQSTVQLQEHQRGVVSARADWGYSLVTAALLPVR